MNRFTCFAMVSALLGWSGPALAQDPVKVDPAHYKVVLENASVRVLRVSLAAGAKTPMHVNPDTIIVPLTNSKVRFTMTDGESVDSDLAASSAQYTPAGSHAGANLGGPGEVIVVEFKGAAAGKAQMQRGVQTLLGLKDLPRPSHVADALGLALTGMARVTGRTPTGRAVASAPRGASAAGAWRGAAESEPSEARVRRGAAEGEPSGNMIT